MKNLVCPVSIEQISENIPRVTAALTIGLLLLYVFTNSILIPVFIVLDFFTRGFGNSKYSLLAIISREINKYFLSTGARINKAPKIFAARLGFVMSVTILILHITGMTYLATTISFSLILFAGLECFLNFCLGCWVYTLFIQPFYKS